MISFAEHRLLLYSRTGMIMVMMMVVKMIMINFVSYTRSAAALLYAKLQGVTHIDKHLPNGVT